MQQVDETQEFTKFMIQVGEANHRLQTYLQYFEVGPQVTVHFSHESRAAYIRERRPDLEPAPVDGVPASDHRVASVFLFYFGFAPFFVAEYLGWLRRNM